MNDKIIEIYVWSYEQCALKIKIISRISSIHGHLQINHHPSNAEQGFVLD